MGCFVYGVSVIVINVSSCLGCVIVVLLYIGVLLIGG